ncbi:MAG: 3-deoxy-8-phosphooctulonate synthase [Bdellovibrionales bacterium]|nr:3-deoxy-8-phosphooctulonate synthase [Bdellovibrionales bacterium]
MSILKPLENIVELKSNIKNLKFGDTSKWVLMAGPDIIEDEGMVLEVGQEIQKITDELGIDWVLKCSFDKANRQSSSSFRGPGWKQGLKQLEDIKSKLNCLLLTDVHETTQVADVASVADIIQIPAFLCRQTDLLIEAAETGKVLHIKKGQFMAPWDMKAIVDKAKAAGNSNVLLCERGTTFGYNRLINDMTGLVDMRNLGVPVIMDCTHSVQLPGAQSTSSGGRREMVPVLARAAMAIGVDGLFMEVHPDPDKALCDGPTSMSLKDLKPLLQTLVDLRKVVV